MRIVHIADTHLGLAAFGRLDENGMNLRERLIYENFLSSVDAVIAVKPDVLVHAGDLFDRVKPKTRAFTTVFEALERLAAAGIPLVVISGNHSMPKTRYTASPFELLQYHNAELYAAYGYRYEAAEIGDAVFHLLPNMLHAADYRTEFDTIALSTSHANILVTHGLAGMLRDRRLRTVAEHELDATILSPDFDYIALGHFHDQRQVADNAWYSGSLEYCSYNEIHDTKGGLLVDTVTGSVGHLALPHTPVLDLDAIACRDKTPREVADAITATVNGYAPPSGNVMVSLTLDQISRETARGIDRRLIADLRSRYLDFRLKFVHPQEGGGAFQSSDIRAVDIVGEFEKFVNTTGLSKRERDFVLKRGAGALKRAVEHRQEEENAAT